MGKEKGPYAKLRGQAEGDSRLGAAGNRNSSCDIEKRAEKMSRVVGNSTGVSNKSLNPLLLLLVLFHVRLHFTRVSAHNIVVTLLFYTCGTTRQFKALEGDTGACTINRPLITMHD